MKKNAFNPVDLILNNWWFRHALFWVVITSYFIWGALPLDFRVWKLERLNSRFRDIIVFLPGWILTVYPLLYILIPKFLLKRKYLLFFVGSVLLLAFASIVAEYVLKMDVGKIGSQDTQYWKVRNNLLPFIHVCGIAASVKLIKYFFLEEKRVITAMQQKTLAELELLKAQIHPHFLFNTLNNLYAHTINNSDKSPEIVLKLSDLLRFMVYESRNEKITLEQEIELLKNYIDLEKLRYGDNLEISMTLSGDYKNKLIAPLLLLPLIENSFKHGASTQTGKSWITLNMDVQEEVFHFKLINSMDQDSDAPEGEKKYRGVGMENVRKRLELIYPGKHSIQMVPGEEHYMVSLSIKLELIDGNEKIVKSTEKKHSHDLEMPVG